MALVESPDLQRETKYSIVKNRIVKAVTPELSDVLVHTNGHAASETDRGEKSTTAELELGDGGLQGPHPPLQAGHLPGHGQLLVRHLGHPGLQLAEHCLHTTSQLGT